MSPSDVAALGNLVIAALTLGWSIRASRNARRTRRDKVADDQRYRDLVDALKQAEDNRTANELRRDRELIAWMEREQRAEGKHNGSSRVSERHPYPLEAESD